MPDFTDMLSKAKDMQAKMKEAQDAIKNIEVEGTAGGDLVKDFISAFPDAKLTCVTEEEDA